MTRSSVQVSAGIRDEAKRHHEVLDRIGGGMGSADGMLRSSVTKFKKVCYMAARGCLQVVVGCAPGPWQRLRHAELQHTCRCFRVPRIASSAMSWRGASSPSRCSTCSSGTGNLRGRQRPGGARSGSCPRRAMCRQCLSRRSEVHTAGMQSLTETSWQVPVIATCVQWWACIWS